MVDLEYIDSHKNDKSPFDIRLYNTKRHLLRENELLYLSTTIQ